MWWGGGVLCCGWFVLASGILLAVGRILRSKDLPVWLLVCHLSQFPVHQLVSISLEVTKLAAVWIYLTLKLCWGVGSECMNASCVIALLAENSCVFYCWRTCCGEGGGDIYQNWEHNKILIVIVETKPRHTSFNVSLIITSRTLFQTRTHKCVPRQQITSVDSEPIFCIDRHDSNRQTIKFVLLWGSCCFFVCVWGG